MLTLGKLKKLVDLPIEPLGRLFLLTALTQEAWAFAHPASYAQTRSSK
jgi:hypothetical protein